MLKGIDVSHYQGDIDFGKVKAAGIQVVIIKATEGKNYQDPKFKRNYNAAKAARLAVGAYHFLRGNAAKDEVNNFLSVVGNLDLDCKLVIDVEVDLGSVDATSKQVRTFADLLKAKGKDVILYSGEYFYNNKLNSSVKDIPLWVAKYSSNKPNVGKAYIGWQYSNKGSVSGISGNVDMNEFSEDILIKKEVVENKNVDVDTLNLQKTLNRLKIRDYKGNSLAEDGKYGSLTKSAVKRLQNICGLSVDGIAGKNTWNAINSILSKPLLKVGSKGIQVRYVQFRVGTTIDGIFGMDTNRKVVIWQGKNGLKQDGIVGSNTWKKLIG